MRKLGMSYTQIKDELGVSKSTLSGWLQHYPLSPERLKELRTNTERQIERIRDTKSRKRSARLAAVREQVERGISHLSDREILIAGLFLYWGEGGKTKPYTTTISNTDPAMLLFFIHWLELLGVDRNRIRAYVHLYADMDAEKEVKYWSTTLKLSKNAFRKPHIKNSNRCELTYKQRFSHGTCNIIFDNRDTAEYVSQALEVIRARFAQGINP